MSASRSATRGRRSRPARRRGRRRSPFSRRARRRRRRGGPISRARALGVIAVIAALVFGITRIDFDDTIRELTLPLRHDDIIRQQAREKNVPADLIAAVIYTESRFRDQTSHAGARGLMQITPDTAHVIEGLSGGETFVTEDLADPEINIRYGTFFLRHLLDRYEGNEVAALAGYNAGMTNADAWGGEEMGQEDIAFPETRSYVNQVLQARGDYREKYAGELGF